MGRFLEIAEPLAQRGIPLTPVRPGTKRAFLPDFPTTATTNLEQIKAWDAQFPDHNAACVARAEEGGVFFWEVDSPDVLARVKAETGHDVIAEVQTFRVRSRPGRGHFYFRVNAESLARLSNISQSYVKGGDWSLRVHREYVVAPNSLHPDTGKPYEALDWTVPIATCPLWLIDWLLSQRVNTTKAVETGKRWDDGLRNESGLIPQGKIHGWMLTVAGRMRAAEMEQDEIEPALLRLVHDNCQGPIDDSKVRAMAKSICNFPPGTKPSESKQLTMGSTGGVAAASTEITPEQLLEAFPAYDGSTPPAVPMLVDGFMPKGATFFGSLSGVGKTWVALDIVKALTSGEPLWGVYLVPEKVAVLYLIPEASAQEFCYRLGKMGMVQDLELFRYRTISEGVTQPLNSPLVYAMVKMLAQKRDVVVVVDTAIRFLRSSDENSSVENSLIKDTELLGALAKETGHDVSFLIQHHSPKASKDAAEMTLENALRGTGDFGAMAHCVYALRRDEELYSGGDGPEEIDVKCVKPRNVFPPPLPFRLAMSRRPKPGEGDAPVSYIDTVGSLHIIGNAGVKDAVVARFIAMIRDNPDLGMNHLSKELRVGKDTLRQLAASRGYRQTSAFAPSGRKRLRWTKAVLEMPGGSPADTTDEDPATVAF